MVEFHGNNNTNTNFYSQSSSHLGQICFNLVPIFVLLMIWFPSFSQRSDKITPPLGMLEIRSGLYVDDTEISVGEYLEFFYYSTDKDLPMTNPKYRPEFPENDMPPYSFLFFYNKNSKYTLTYGENTTIFGIGKLLPIPADSVKTMKAYQTFGQRYLQLPISFISYEQALAYCQWRTRMTSLSNQSNFIFELPSKEEFDSFNEDLDSIKTFGSQIIPSGNYLNCSTQNSKKKFKLYKDAGKAAFVVASFYSNNNGLYDIQGNVAEMSSEEGIALGGSFMHPYDSSLKGKIIKYDKPEKWLGFRCIARVKSIN